LELITVVTFIDEEEVNPVKRRGRLERKEKTFGRKGKKTALGVFVEKINTELYEGEYSTKKSLARKKKGFGIELDLPEQRNHRSWTGKINEKGAGPKEKILREVLWPLEEATETSAANWALGV